MKTSKRLIAMLLALVTLFGVLSIGVQAANVYIKNKNLAYGYMLPTDRKYSKALSKVYLYDNYDYLYFQINSKSKDAGFVYIIYKDSETQEVVGGDEFFPNAKGVFNVYAKTKLTGELKNGTYICACVAAIEKSNGDVVFDQDSMYAFEIVVDKTTTTMSKKTTAIKSLEITLGGPKIKWHKVNNATKYVIYRSKNGGAKEKIASVKSGTYEYVDKAMKNKSVNLQYYIYAYDKNGKKSKAFHDATMVYAGAPTLKSAEVKSDNRVLIKWDKVSGSSGYRIYRKTKGTSWKKLADVSSSATSYYDTTSKKNNTKYYYIIKSYKTVDGTRTYSKYNDAVYTTFLKAPTLKSAVTTENGINIKWSDVSGVNSFVILRKAADSPSADWVRAGTAKPGVVEFTDKKADVTKSYIYSVRADGKDFKGSYDSNGIRYDYTKLPEPETTVPQPETTVPQPLIPEPTVPQPEIPVTTEYYPEPPTTSLYEEESTYVDVSQWAQ